MLLEFIREFLFVFVGIIFIHRTYSLLITRSNTPLWFVLLIIEVGVISIQSWFGLLINNIFGVPDVNNLLMALIGILDMYSMLIFCQKTKQKITSQKSNCRLIFIHSLLAVCVALLLIASYSFTPITQRYNDYDSAFLFKLYDTVIGLYFGYMSICVFWNSLKIFYYIKQIFLKIIYLLLAIGNLLELPFTSLTTLKHVFRIDLPENVRYLPFLLSITRFIIVSFACSFVAIIPKIEEWRYNYKLKLLSRLGAWIPADTPFWDPLLLPKLEGEKSLNYENNYDVYLHLLTVEILDGLMKITDYLHDNFGNNHEIFTRCKKKKHENLSLLLHKLRMAKAESRFLDYPNQNQSVKFLYTDLFSESTPHNEDIKILITLYKNIKKIDKNTSTRRNSRY